MWIDRRKRFKVSAKLDSYEMAMLESMARSMDVSKGEMIRRAILTTRLLLDPDIPLKNMVKETNWNKPLVDIIKPFPEIAAEIKLELQLWYQLKKENKIN